MPTPNTSYNEAVLHLITKMQTLTNLVDRTQTAPATWDNLALVKAASDHIDQAIKYLS